ncbi:hypothetical protein MHK_003130, partial [Candidatus Magnetomorum sp. HK-1]
HKFAINITVHYYVSPFQGLEKEMSDFLGIRPIQCISEKSCLSFKTINKLAFH